MFQLHNDPPTPPRPVFENDTGRQSLLLHDMNDLPGQGLMFPINGSETSERTMKRSKPFIDDDMGLTPDEEPEPDTCCECNEIAVGYSDGLPWCAEHYRSRP